MELGLTPDTRRVVDTATMVDAARAAGFTALGMVAGRAGEEAPALLEAAGLRCHELLGLQVTGDVDAVDATAKRLAHDAALVGASWVLATFEAAPTSDVVEAVRRCAAMFEEAGAGLAVEFSPLGPVATVSDALAVLAATNRQGTGMVVDSWNFCFGSSTWGDLERVPLDAIAYVQFTDARAPVAEPNLQEAMHRRALPGAGVLPLDRFAATLRERGWDGVVSMQVLSDELRLLPVAEYARRVYAAGARYWH
jgi:sugar phosphate isomerase/epimerase